MADQKGLRLLIGGLGGMVLEKWAPCRSKSLTSDI